MPFVNRYLHMEYTQFVRRNIYRIILWTGMLIGTVIVNIYINKTGKSFMINNDFLSVYEDFNIAPENLWEYVLVSRIKLWIAILVLALFPKVKFIFGIIALYGGVITGIMISAITAFYGNYGVLIFLAGIFPQYIFYIASILVMYYYVKKMRNVKLAIPMIIISLLLVIVGTYLEGYVNPLILKGIYKIVY